MVWLVAGTTFLSALREGAEHAPDRPSLTCGSVTLTRAGFLGQVERLAGLFESRGVSNGSNVSIGLPNSADFVVAMFAAWAVGAVPQPISSPASRPPNASPSWTWPARRWSLACPRRKAGGWPVLESVPADLPAGRFTPSMSPELKAVASGGSTGRPKLIVTTAPAVVEASASAAALLGMRPDGQVLMTGPLYHNGPFSLTAAAIGTGNHVVLMSRFDALQTVRLIEKHQVTWLYLVPTMMLRIWRLPEDERMAAGCVLARGGIPHRSAVPGLAQAGVDRMDRPPRS